MPNSVTITGTVTDSFGAVFNYSAVGTQDVITGTAAITPAVAPAGATRTLTVTGVSSAGGTLTFPTPVSAGLTFTPVSGQPAGQMQWTFVY